MFILTIMEAMKSPFVFIPLFLFIVWGCRVVGKEVAKVNKQKLIDIEVQKEMLELLKAQNNK